jgi:hypothetical protein
MGKCYSSMYNKAVNFFRATCRERSCPVMRLLEYLVEVFIQTFGITRPTEAQRKRVTFLLGGALLVAALLVVALAIGMVFYLHMSH